MAGFESRVRLRKKPDSKILISAAALVFIGLVEIYSSSVVVSFERFGSNYFYISRQLLFLLPGLAALWAFSKTDYRFWRHHTKELFFGTIFLLSIVLLIGQGDVSGANRWISLGNFFIQPSEFAKLTFILYLAAFFDRKSGEIANFKRGFLPFALTVVVVSTLVMLEPDLGTTSILAIIAISLYFLAGAPFRHLAIGSFAALLGFLALIRAAPYRLARLRVFLNPDLDPQGIGYHLKNALIAVGSGGLFGRGFGQSLQKHLYLPSAHTDSIIAIAAEELGFIRISVILLIYLFFVLRAFRVARLAPDRFGRLVAAGIGVWFFFQAFLNIAANLSLMPLTGVPLPFISYGGSSLVVSLAAVGLLLNISRTADRAAD